MHKTRSRAAGGRCNSADIRLSTDRRITSSIVRLPRPDFQFAASHDSQFDPASGQRKLAGAYSSGFIDSRFASAEAPAPTRGQLAESSCQSAAGMTAFVNRLEAAVFDVGVNLRGLHAGVTEHFLQRTDLSAARQHMGRKAMPQRVRADFGAAPARAAYFFTRFQTMIRERGVPRRETNSRSESARKTSCGRSCWR